MSWIAEHWIVLLYLGLYTAMLVRHALEGHRETRDVSDYYIGGRTMGGVVLGLSFFATYSSTNSFVGFSGQSYSYGAPWLLLAPAVVVFSVVAWVWVAPRLRHFTAALDSLTIPDFIGFRYDSGAARQLAAGIVLFASFLYITAIFKGIATTLEAFLDIPYWLAIWLVFVIVMTYTAVGGFISVVRTDAVQGVLLVGAAAILFGGTVRGAGGLGSFFDVAERPATSHLFSWDAAMPFPVLIGIIVAGTMKFIVEPRQLSRFYALRDRDAARTGMWVSAVAFLVVYAMLVPIGIYAHNVVTPDQLGPAIDTDHVVPTLLTDPQLFHPGLSGFILVALVAAAMSSLDSVLLVMASTFHRDLVEPWVGEVGTAAAIRATRWYVALFALITTLIALDPPGTIVLLTAFSGSLYAACFFPAIVLGLHWRRGSGAAVITSFVVGLAVLLLWRPLAIAPGVHEVFPALALSTLAYVAVAASTAVTESPRLERIFAELG